MPCQNPLDNARVTVNQSLLLVLILIFSVAGWRLSSSSRNRSRRVLPAVLLSSFAEAHSTVLYHITDLLVLL